MEDKAGWKGWEHKKGGTVATEKVGLEPRDHKRVRNKCPNEERRNAELRKTKHRGRGGSKIGTLEGEKPEGWGDMSEYGNTRRKSPRIQGA